LTVGVVGCAEDTATTDDTTTTTPDATTPENTDADTEADVVDEAPAEPETK
jgi:hypothetical protein